MDRQKKRAQGKKCTSVVVRILLLPYSTDKGNQTVLSTTVDMTVYRSLSGLILQRSAH